MKNSIQTVCGYGKNHEGSVWMTEFGEGGNSATVRSHI